MFWTKAVRLTPDGTEHTNVGSMTITSVVGGSSLTNYYRGTVTLTGAYTESDTSHNNQSITTIVNINPNIIATPDYNPNGCEVSRYSSNAILYIGVNGCTTQEQLNTYLASHPIQINYALATETAEAQSAFTSTIEIDDYGTMRFEKNSAISVIPVGNEIFYPADYVLLIDDLNNYVNGDVTELLKWADFPIPAPTGLADGTYKLVATISGGVASLSWESDS